MSDTPIADRFRSRRESDDRADYAMVRCSCYWGVHPDKDNTLMQEDESCPVHGRSDSEMLKDDAAPVFEEVHDYRPPFTLSEEHKRALRTFVEEINKSVQSMVNPYRVNMANTDDDYDAKSSPLDEVSRALHELHCETKEARYIMDVLLPDWLALFLEKNEKYKRVEHLGSRGVFPDVNRKVGILKDRIWNGEDSPGEPTDEVILDLIGHLFLMRVFLDREECTEGKLDD